MNTQFNYVNIFSHESDLNNFYSTLNQKKVICLKNLRGSLVSFLLAEINSKFNVPVLYLSKNQNSAISTSEDCKILIGEGSVSLFIFDAFHAAKVLDNSHEILRNETIEKLINKKNGIVCADIFSVSKFLPSPEESNNNFINISLGEEFGFANFQNKINQLNFTKKDFVHEIGEYSIRGGIVDVFPFNSDTPIRIEFFDDKIESIRFFDVATQCSIKKINTFEISANLFEANRLSNSTIFDYLPKETIIVYDDLTLLKNSFEDLKNEGIESDINFDELILKFSGFLQIENCAFTRSSDEIDFNSTSQISFGGNLKYFLTEINKFIAEDYKIFLLSNSEIESVRLKELILSFDEEVCSKINFINESIHSGFVSHKNKIVCFTEHEIFNKIKPRIKRKKFSGITKSALKTLHYGDFIVHIDYGIGKFLGLQKIKIKGHEQEAAKIEYADGGKLYVNLNFIDRIQKYSSSEGHTPELNKLGSSVWNKLQEKAKKKIKDIARDLIKIYAKRKSEIGFAAQPDTIWQKELEASFEFDDTPDQTRATNEIKVDMESEAPMDRLVCGDVGFGKTEVAIRAAFKIVMSGKQVAVLVPTTILAQQHFNTFKKRLENYSLRVEMISRFRTKKEIKNILEETKNNQVDVLIGTHRILSKDVVFENLGLLIIDEEHRFGVASKEKLRSLKTNIDTLTLTATPIPRTLQFSLFGARDLSIINTPPKNRLPIQTEIIEFNEKIIREAILHEINRGGQVFIVNDQIKTIEKLSKTIEKLLPDVKFKIAHGQLHGKDLENIMLEFLNKKFSVLITTKIIESGLDVSNANTIIINRADKFGMAELHQLRGRVGRSNQQAFAYLMVPSLHALSKDAIVKLQAIEEFNEFGSGLTLSMRDLEIRGSGNLLGAEQSGFIFDMGFEMYERVLQEAIEELKNAEFPEIKTSNKKENKIDTVVEVDFDALIPSDYVFDQSERLSVYKKLLGCNTELEILNLKNDILDRFGKIPIETENLFLIFKIKLLGSMLSFKKIEIEENIFKILFPDSTDVGFYENGLFQKIMDLVTEKYSSTINLIQKENKLFLMGRFKSSDSVLNQMISFLKELI